MQNSFFSKIIISIFAFAAIFIASAQISAHEHGAEVRKGEFVGKSDHITTGNVKVKKVANGYIVKLADNFSLDGAPAPRVGFGKDGKYDESAELGTLVSIKGKQVYVVPASVDVSKYNEVYIWCEQFSVPLGVATLK